MKSLLIKWIVNSLAIIIVTYIVKGIEIASPQNLFILLRPFRKTRRKVLDEI